MPGYDRTGPLGNGPRSGRGMGRCGTDYNNDDSGSYGFGQGGRGGQGRGQGGLGRGRGQGGLGRGLGRGQSDVYRPRDYDSINRQNDLLEKITGKLERIVEKLDLKD